MPKPISLFNEYHGKENTISNYTGLILKLLYEENPASFEQLLFSLIPSSIDNFSIIPDFYQQTKKGDSIPDIVIEQKSFSLYIETKNFDWFYDSQIDKHLESLKSINSDFKILLLLSSDFKISNSESQFKKQISQAFEDHHVVLSPITFETLANSLSEVDSSDSFKKTVAQYDNYLDRNSLLPNWEYLLDVVNCTTTIQEIENHNYYMCPDRGRGYSHRRAKYFGPYKNKKVTSIYEIKALVVIEKNLQSGEVRWNNINTDSKELIAEAMEKIANSEFRKNENSKHSLQVFLLQNRAETNFIKESSGGLYGSKIYFRNIAKKHNAKNSQELADALNNKTWESI